MTDLGVLLLLIQFVFCGNLPGGNQRVFPKDESYIIKVAHPDIQFTKEELQIIELAESKVNNNINDQFIILVSHPDLEYNDVPENLTNLVKRNVVLNNYKDSKVYGLLSKREDTITCSVPYIQSEDEDEEEEGDLIFKSFSSPSNKFTIYSNRMEVKFLQNNGLELQMKKQYDNPFMGSDFPIKYGKVEAEFKSAFGKGIISSIYLQSDDLDEIDLIETFGSFPQTYQTNYFVKGDTSNHNRGVYHFSAVPLTEEYQKIRLEWTEDRIGWYFNDLLVREIFRGDSLGFPDSPMFLKISLWAGGDEGNSPGTIEWAGGLTDYALLPAAMFVKNLYIQDYSTGDEYIYGDYSKLVKRSENITLVESSKNATIEEVNSTSVDSKHRIWPIIQAPINKTEWYMSGGARTKIQFSTTFLILFLLGLG